MKFLTGISKSEILDYLKLEEDEGTADLLKRSSLLYVGSAATDVGKTHYWSYPTPDGVAWVSYSSDGGLGTEVEEDVPRVIRDSTASREKHPVRKVARSPSLPPDRSPIPKARWIPLKEAPRLFYFPMHFEGVSMKHAASVFAARPLRSDVGIRLWVLHFCVKLTSGRYAVIGAREDSPEQISIELEVEDSKKDYPHGYVHVADLREILAALGREVQLPLKNCQYHWRE